MIANDNNGSGFSGSWLNCAQKVLLYIFIVLHKYRLLIFKTLGSQQHSLAKWSLYRNFIVCEKVLSLSSDFIFFNPWNKCFEVFFLLTDFFKMSLEFFPWGKLLYSFVFYSTEEAFRLQNCCIISCSPGQPFKNCNLEIRCLNCRNSD